MTRKPGMNMRSTMKKINTIKIINLAVFALILAAASCVTDRPMRTGVFNENVYLNKDFLTRENPMNPEADDMGWLQLITVTAVSTPNLLGDYLFPGLEGTGPNYVRFTLTQDSIHMVNAVEILEGDFPDALPPTMTVWPGEHVDLQLRQNLDGEKTNYLEENKERPWQDRQNFKVDFAKSPLSDINTLAWFYDYFAAQCAEVKAVTLVPDSYEYVDTVAHKSNMCDSATGDCAVDWEKGDYMSWTVRATLEINYEGACFDLMAYALNAYMLDVDLKYSFWRMPADEEGQEYVPREIKEKDNWRKKFGIFDVLQVYTDPDTLLTGATFKMGRFNPREPEHVYYFTPGFPDEYKPLFDQIAEDTNAIMEEAGVAWRMRYAEHDEDNMKRTPGDLRYSFVDVHRNQYTTLGLLGYGPPHLHPLTGEIIGGVTNLYDFGFQYYTFILRDFLEQVSDAFDDLQEGGDPLPEPCTPGDVMPVIPENVQQDLYNTTLYKKMTEYMGGETPETWVPQHTPEWYNYYHMLLNDYRFAVPWWNLFVYEPAEDMVARREGMAAIDRDWRTQLDMIDHGINPVGIDDATAPGYIEAGVDHLRTFRAGMKNSFDMQMEKEIKMGQRCMDAVDGPSLLQAVPSSSRLCKEDGTWETFDEWEHRIIMGIVAQGGIHEFGHNIGLRHNFYGSVDAVNVLEGAPGNSIMDYVNHIAEAGAPHTWWPYDKAALIYSHRYDTQEAVAEETDPDIWAILNPEDPGMTGEVTNPELQYLYCTDEHRYFSPYCRAFDLGVTPTELVMDVVTRYDWMYKIRNFRSYRQFWDTWYYPDNVLSYIFPLRRFLEQWLIDWDAASLESDLRMYGVEGDYFFFDNITEEFAQEMGQANRLAVNFMQAILQQSTGERSYATTYDSFYGDVTRQGIIYDKYYAMLTFMGLWPVDSYNQDVYSYLAYYEYDWGNSQLYSDSLNILDSMLGGQYDVYPWFLPLAVLVFAQDTHDINFGDQMKKEWIGFRKFVRIEDMVDFFGIDPRDEALGSADDGHQVFHDADGNLWIYVFLQDRNVHLCVPYDKSPASYKLVWDYNEAVNIDRADYIVTYEMKYWLDYYEYFN
jgi:hypothetical protein